MRTSSRLIAAVLMMAFFAGCATAPPLKFSSDQDPAANVAGWKTYDWAPGKQTTAPDSPFDMTFLDSRIRAAVDQALADKGIVRRPRGEASFLVSYYVAEKDVQQIETTGHTVLDNPYSANFNAGWRPGDVEVYHILRHMGTLTLRVTDPKSGKLLWHGSATTELHRGENDQQKEALIQSAITGILQRFPMP